MVSAPASEVGEQGERLGDWRSSQPRRYHSSMRNSGACRRPRSSRRNAGARVHRSPTPAASRRLSGCSGLVEEALGAVGLDAEGQHAVIEVGTALQHRGVDLEQAAGGEEAPGALDQHGARVQRRHAGARPPIVRGGVLGGLGVLGLPGAPLAALPNRPARALLEHAAGVLAGLGVDRDLVADGDEDRHRDGGS